MHPKILVNSQRQRTIRLLPKIFVNLTPNLLNPLANFLANLKIHPNALTFFSLLSGLGAGIFFGFEHPLWALIFIILCGIFDSLDGKVAVQERKKSLYGAIFDSTLDRYAEFFIYLGLAIYFRDHWALWLTFWTILGAFMVSYTRARAEGLGIKCKIGLMQRAERMVSLTLGISIGLLFNVFDYAMIAALAFIALFSNITAIQRALFVRKIEKLEK